MKIQPIKQNVPTTLSCPKCGGTLLVITAVLSGGQAVLIYAIEPNRKGAVEVRVRAGGDWRVTGVLGGALDAAALSTVVTTRGVAGATGRLLAGSGAGCRVAFGERGR